MGYLIALLVTLIIISVILIIFSDDSDKLGIGVLCIYSIMLILLFTINFATSNYVANSVINDYKKGKYKEIIVIEEQDTTYKYVYKCEE